MVTVRFFLTARGLNLVITDQDEFLVVLGGVSLYLSPSFTTREHLLHLLYKFLSFDFFSEPCEVNSDIMSLWFLMLQCIFSKNEDRLLHNNSTFFNKKFDIIEYYDLMYTLCYKFV